jgi:uncharacterized membrane protein YbhN (UPF0104 family)
MKWLKFLVSGALLGWLAWHTNWEQVGQAFAGLRCQFWLAAVALYAATQVLSAWRWRLLSRPLGFDRPLRHFVGFYFIGMFFNLMLPTSVGGDVIRAWYLDPRPGRRLAAFVSVLIERASGLFVLVLLACLATLFCPIALPGWVPWMVFGTTAGGGLALTVVYIYSWWQSKHAQHASASRLVLVREQVVALLRRWPLLAGTTLLSLAVQAANIFIVWLVAQGLNLEVPGFYYWIAIPMVTLLTLLPSISGIGVREWGMKLFLMPLGVPEGLALSLSFLWFAVFTLCSVCGGFVYLFGRFPSPEVEADGPVGNHSDQGRARQFGAAA